MINIDKIIKDAHKHDSKTVALAIFAEYLKYIQELQTAIAKKDAALRYMKKLRNAATNLVISHNGSGMPWTSALKEFEQALASSEGSEGGK